MAERATEPVRGRLLVYFDAHECRPDEAEYDKMLDGLDSLALQVENFPQHDLRVVIAWKDRTNEFVVKLSLLLPGKTIMCSDHDPVLHAAFERCVDSIVENVKAYKDALGRVPERQKAEGGTLQNLMPDVPIDAAALDAAAAAGTTRRTGRRSPLTRTTCGRGPAAGWSGTPRCRPRWASGWT